MNADGAQAQNAIVATDTKVSRAKPKTNADNDYKREYEECIQSVQARNAGSSDRYVRCEICYKFPEIVRRNCTNNRPPAITSENGTRFRTQTVVDHFASTYHKECRQAKLLKNQEIGKKNNNKSLIDMHISEANKMYANLIGKLMLQVYTDAKRLTVSAHSWPARFIASECGLIFDFNSVRESTVPENINIQYVNPAGHLKLLTTIVNSWDELQSKIQNSLACSIHVDGSVVLNSRDTE